MSDELDVKLVALYREGRTLHEIAEALGCSVSHVFDRIERLREGGEDLPRRKPRWSAAERARLARRRRENASLRQLEREFEITRGSLTSQLRTLRRLEYKVEPTVKRVNQHDRRRRRREGLRPRTLSRKGYGNFHRIVPLAPLNIRGKAIRMSGV